MPLGNLTWKWYNPARELKRPFQKQTRKDKNKIFPAWTTSGSDELPIEKGCSSPFLKMDVQHRGRCFVQYWTWEGENVLMRTPLWWPLKVSLRGPISLREDFVLKHFSSCGFLWAKKKNMEKKEKPNLQNVLCRPPECKGRASFSLLSCCPHPFCLFVYLFNPFFSCFLLTWIVLWQNNSR